MTSRLRQMRPEGCLSEFALDRRHAGEMDGDETHRTDAHLAACARCRDLDSVLARGRAEFARSAPPLRVAEIPPAASARSRFRVLLGGAGVTFAAAAAVILYVVARPVPSTINDTRAKGSDAPRLGFYVNHLGSVRRGDIGERVAAGDRLRFVTTTREDRWLAVLSVDGRRQVSVYWPEGPEMARVDVGKDVGLPTSTVLDDVVGQETIYGVFCSRPMPIEPIRHALELTPTRPPSPEGCTVETVMIEKP